MTLYDLIEHLAHSITASEDNNQYHHLINYLHQSLDDNKGFLRSRYCRRTEGPLPDREIGKVFCIVCGLTHPFNINQATFTSNGSIKDETNLSLQILWITERNGISEGIEYCFETGYKIVYAIDIGGQFT